jgi:signal transduction histidine kinase
MILVNSQLHHALDKPEEQSIAVCKTRRWLHVTTADGGMNMDWRKGSLSSLAEGIRGWFHRADPVELDREWNLRLEERRRERTRIARELHDKFLQGILSASMQLHVAEEQLPEGSPLKPTLRRALELLEKGMNDSRAALQELRSAAITSTSLENVLSILAEEFTPEDRARLRIEVIGRAETLDAALVEEIFLITREALFNAMRHSQATCVEAELEYLPRKLRVVVRDNGSGFDSRALNTRQHSHWGLLGMRERAAAVGAQLRVWSRPGGGTEVELSVRIG